MNKKYSYAELLRMEKSTISLTKRELKGIVFGYADMNAGEEQLGGIGGFSIIIYDTRIVEVRRYLFPEILAEERIYSVDEKCISEIRQEYQKYESEIPFIYAPDNGSCDGSISYFYFGHHWINALNIDYADEKIIKRIREVHPNNFDYWMSIVNKENQIMEIFFSICHILRKYGIILEQFSVIVNGELTE